MDDRKWLKGCLYLCKNGKREYLLKSQLEGYHVIRNLRGRERERIWIQGKPVGKVLRDFTKPSVYYDSLGFEDPPDIPSETDEEYIDYDSVIGHWIEGAIYAWKHGTEWKKTGRRYVVDELTDSAFSSTECEKFFGQIRTLDVSKVYDLRIQGKRVIYDFSIEEMYSNEGLNFPNLREIFLAPKKYITSVSRAKLTPLRLPDDYTHTPGPVLREGKIPFGSFELASRLYYLDKGLPIYYPFYIPEYSDSIMDFFTETSILIRDEKVQISRDLELAFLNALQKPKIEFIAVDVGLTRKDKKDGHANILFVDKKRKLVELIDPHGKSTWNFNAESILKDIQYQLELDNYKLYRSEQVCPRNSFQTLENTEREEDSKTDLGGYCAQWTHWILELRALNPELPPHKVYKLAIDTIEHNRKSLSFIIRTYTKRVREIAYQLDLLFHTNRVEFYRYVTSFYYKQL